MARSPNIRILDITILVQKTSEGEGAKPVSFLKIQKIFIEFQFLIQEEMIIGKKKVFAVEFHTLLDAIPPFGRICYWVGGETYGDIELLSTLGLLLGGLDTEKQSTKLFLQKDIQQEGLDKTDFDDISLQVLQRESIVGNYEYNGYSLTIEAAESFDSCQVFLLEDMRQNAWIIAEDFEEQRYCCIDVNVNDIQDIFLNLSNKLHGLLELHHR